MCVKTIEVKSADSKVNIFRVISPSEAREQTAWVWGRCKPPMGPGAKPRKILRFQDSRSPKIDNSMRKSSCSVSSRVRVLGKFCPWIAVTTS